MCRVSQGQHSTYKEVWSGWDVICSADHWSRHQHRRHASDKPDKNVKVINIVKKSKYKLERNYLNVGQERKNVAQSPQQLTSTCIAGACGWQLWKNVNISGKVGSWNTLRADCSTVELVLLGMLAEGYHGIRGELHDWADMNAIVDGECLAE